MVNERRQPFFGSDCHFTITDLLSDTYSDNSTYRGLEVRRSYPVYVTDFKVVARDGIEPPAPAFSEPLPN